MERCPQSQLARPSVTTLVADPSEPTRAAYVVTPACDEELLTLVYGKGVSGMLAAHGRGIEAVISVPTTTEQLMLDDNRLASFDLRAATSVTDIRLASNNISSLTGFVFPESLLELSLSGNPIDMVTATQFPSRIDTLWLSNTTFTSFVGTSFPTSLVKLDVGYMTKLQSMQGLVLPPQLKTLYASQTATSEIVGVTFPVTLSVLYIGGNEQPVTRFDIRATDLSLLSSIKLVMSKSTDISACVDPRGSIQTLQSPIDYYGVQTILQACVYPDEVFAELFLSSAGEGNTNSPSTTSTTDDPVATSPQQPAPTTTSVSSPPPTNSGSSNSISTETDSRTTTQPPSQADSLTPNNGATVSTATAILVLVATVALIAAAFLLRRRRKRTSARAPAKKTTTQQLTSSALLMPLVANDVREDATFIQFKIPVTDLVVQSALEGTSDFTSVYQATLYGRDVLVTRFQHTEDASIRTTATASSTQALQSFVDEIRLWATLDHPAIVAFVGVSWTQSELSLVTEWMAQGDLRSLIQRDIGGSTSINSSWFHHQIQQEGTEKPNEPGWSKATIAVDVAVGLVYLHSFTPPILHGDVSTTNVLVSTSYRAKLSNFGVSGYGDGEDDTMVYSGSSAIAPPEIQRGEQYSTKADVYGLGTLLEELAASGGADCPLVIRELVAVCLQADPSDRPAPMEVHYRLRQAIASARIDHDV